ncbi:RNA polymerase sigma factor [Thalassotalea insulae]|uniref:RNA polymerase sigma factor n=1 Tax=Thalassotalea insulae TaxID=2056778 RepID=UPI0024E0F679|nr:RNA polymerase sigma factor [Thalassotalea insulae]
MITRAQRGDLSAHEKLFIQFSTPVFNLALRLCNQKELAEDVLQNTFVNVIKGIDGFQCQAPFGMWLRKIAVNESLMMLRKNKKLPDFIAFDSMEDFDNVIELGTQGATQSCGIHQYQVQSTLEKTLAELPDASRIVIWLKEVEGYSHQEIAELLGKSESYSKSILSRAFKSLSRCFGVTDEAEKEKS